MSAVFRVGLLSDSHGCVEITRRAVRLLIGAGADMLLYLGDLECGEVLEALAGNKQPDGQPERPVRVVFGNVDFDVEHLTWHARELGIAVDHPTGRLELDGKTLVYHHGHMGKVMNQALADGVDYLCHGHSHMQRDERQGRTRLINPGALHRAREYTVALLTVPEDRLEFLTVPKHAE